MEPLAILNTIIMVVGVAVVPFLLFRHFSKKLSPFEKIADVAGVIFDDFSEDSEDNKAKITGLIDTLTGLGNAATGINVILSDEEAFESFMTILASKIRKSMIGSFLGTASGDSKRMAKAETLVNKAIVDGATKLNPIIGMLIKSTGLDEVLQEDPEMFDYILQVIANKDGLMSMFANQNMSIPGLGDQDSATGGGVNF